jgi:hypothetical protein
MRRKRSTSGKLSEILVRTRHAVGTTFVAVVILCAADAVLPASVLATNANATSSGMNSCSTSVLREAVSTSQRIYGSSSLVVMTSSVRNVSRKSCSVGVGPTSPSFTVTNAQGVTVWNNCFVNDRPGACALYLVAHTLKPGATFATTVRWDQRAGQPPTRAPTGAYRLTAQVSDVAGHRTTSFELAATVSPESITVTQADEGGSYSLQKGGHLYVQLIGPANYTWSQPVSSNGAVLERSSGTSGAIATATFIGTSTGQVHVTAVDNPNCYPQCLPPSRLFSITVSVVN